MEDMTKKNRSAKTYGSINGNSKLSESKVVEIRIRYATEEVLLKDLAFEYKVAISLIHRIIKRQVWKHC